MYTTDTRPTQETYDGLARAYDHFNWALFNNDLPQCLITLQRKGRTYGYFCRKRFARNDGASCDEIALNPAHFAKRGLEDICATLVHEMTHLWQHHYGRTGRGRYHNRQWADKMKALGLYPSDTGKPGGRETGDRMAHYIIADGPFARAYSELQLSGFAIEWQDSLHHPETRPAGEGGGKQPRTSSKGGRRVKYSCPQCGLNAWAKHDASLLCGADRAPMTPA